MAKSPAKKPRFKTSNLKSKVKTIDFSKKHFRQIVSSRRFQFAVVGFFIIICLSILLIIANNQMAKAEASWPQTLNNWGKRKRLKLTNNSSATLHTNSTFAVNINTKGLYDSGYLQNDCDDIRIYYQPNNSTAIDLNYYFDPAAGATNCSDSESTKFYFPLQADMSSGASSNFYYVYLNNSSATAKASVDAFDIGSKQALMVCPFNADTDCINGDGAESPTTESGAIRYSGGKSALRFNGNVSEKIEVSANSTINNLAYNAFTVEAYLNASRTVGHANPMIFDKSNYGSVGWRSYFNKGTGKLTFQVYCSTINGVAVSASNSIVGDTWQHIALVYDDDGDRTPHIFINGTETTYDTTPTACDGNTLDDSAKALRIPDNSQKFSGMLDEVRVSDIARYTSNFTPSTQPFVRDDHTRVLWHMDEAGDDPRNTGKVIDDSGNGNHGTPASTLHYVTGIVGVDASTSDSGNVPSQSYADHSGVFIEEGTTNLVTNPSYENISAYDTNWQNGGNSFSTFTPGVAKRNSAGPFAAGVSLQGRWDAASSSQDVLTFPRGTQIYSNFFSQLDPYQGSVVFWITPEWNGNDNKYHPIISGSYNFLLNKATNNTLTFTYRRLSDDTWHSVTTDISSWVAGQTHQVVVSWDSNNAIQGSNFVRLSIDDTHTYGGDQPKVYLPYTDIRVGSDSNSNFSADAIIEGLTIYRRPLFDGTYGIDVGNGDEIWKTNGGSSHTGSNNASTLTDSSLGWGSNAYLGGTIINQTDGSSGVITSNGFDTLTATLTGGSENDWDTGDLYIVTGAGGVNPTSITGSWDVVFALPTNGSTGGITTGTGEAWSHPHASNLLYTSTTNTGGFMMNGTYTSDGWADEGTPSSVSALSSTEKIYGGGYKVTSDATNEGIYYAKTVTAGDDWVLRAVGNSDGTCSPRVILYDQTHSAEIGHLDGTTSSTRITPDTYIFTGEAPSGMTALRVKLVNTASSGTCYWHQVEVLANRADNSSLERGSGSPWCASGWNCGSYNNSDQSTDSHSGTYSAHFVQSSGSYNWLIWSGFSYTKTINKFYSTGHFSKSASNATVFEIDAYPTYIPLPKVSTNASWTHKASVIRQSVSGGYIRMGGTGYASSYYIDDFYITEMSDVSLTVTPATSTNSIESSKIRVDGYDKYSHTLPSPTTSAGTITFDYTPRHNAADVAKFGESTPAIAYFTDTAASSGIHNSSSNASVLTDSTKAWTTNQWVGFTIRNISDGSTATVTANTATTVTATLSGGSENDWDASDKYYIETDDFIKLYWSAANTIALEYSMAGTGGKDEWDATSAISAGTKYDFEITYTGSGSMTLKVDDVTKITLSSIPAAFGTAPTLAYWGSDSSGAQQGDAAFLPEPATMSESTTAPYYKFGAAANKIDNTKASDGRGFITQIDPNSTASHTLSAYVYNGTTGAIGGTVDNTVAQLVWEGTAQSSTVYTDMGGGWWRLTYTATTTDATNDYGVQALSSKTIYVDGLQLEQKAYATTYTDGSLGASYSWSGTADASSSSRTESDLRLDTSSNIIATAGSISLWFKPDWSTSDINSSTKRKTLISTGSPITSGSNDLYLFYNEGGAFFFYVDASSTSAQKVVTITKNQWVHIVATWNGSNSYLYVNNSASTVANYSQSLNPSTLYVGKRSSGQIVNGVIENLSIHSSALSSTEISDLYYSGLGAHQIQEGYTDSYSGQEPPVLSWHFNEGYGTTAHDSTVNKNDGTISSATWSTYDPSGLNNTNSLQFDGSSSYVYRDYSSDSELSPGTDDFSISTWFRSPSTVSSQMNIITRYNSSGYKVYMNSSGNVCFGIDDDSTWGPDDYACSTATFNDSSWHHISAVKTSTSIKLYIDTLLDGEDNSLSAINSLSGSHPTFYIGVDSDGASNYWKGFIDEVSVFGYSQSEEQVKGDFISTGTDKGNTFTQKSNEILSDGLVGYWKMDESTTASCSGGGDACDSSGNDNEGTLYGTAATTSGKYGNGVILDGDSDYIQVATNSIVSPTAGTWSAWIKADTVNERRHILYAGDSGDGWGTEDELHLSMNTTNQISFIHHDVTYGDDISISSSFSDTTSWHLVTSSWDSSTLIANLYLDGILVGTDTFTTSFDKTDWLDQFRIGVSNNTGSSRYFDGNVDEVRIYNRALSPAEVQGLYKWAPGPVAYWNFDEGSGTIANDLSGNGNDGTLGGDGVGTDIPIWTEGKFGKALSFDGTDDYVKANVTQSGGKRHLTLSAWVNTTSSNKHLVTRQGTTYALYVESSGVARFRTVTESYPTQSPLAAKSTTVINDGKWYYLTGVWDGDNQTASIYVNGKLEGTATTDSDDDLGSDLYYTYTGGYDLGSSYSSSIIDEVKLYNYARTQEQIVSDMNAGHPAPGSPVGSPLVYYKMDEGFGTSYANSGNAGSAYSMSFSSGATYPIQWSSDARLGKSLSFGTQSLSKMGTYLSDLEYRDEDGLTLSAWIKPNASETDGGAIISKPWNSSGYYNYTLTYESNNKIKLSLRGNNLSQLSSSATINTDAWHHILVTVTGSTREVRFYIDGKFDSSYTHNVTDWSTVSDLNLGLAIGCVYPYAIDCSAGAQYAFYGNIDEVKIYKFALSDAQVQAEYNQGQASVFGSLGTDSSGNPSNASDRAYCPPGDTTANCGPVAEWNFEEASGQYANDTSGNGNQGTLGATSGSSTDDPAWVNGKFGKALEFDGSSDEVNIAAGPTLSTNATLEGWFYWTTNGTSGSSLFRDNTCSLGWILGFDNGGHISYRVGGTQFNTSETTSTYQNKWVHFAATKNGTATAYYINGIQVFSGTGANNVSSALPWHVMKNGSCVGQYISGKADQIRLYDYARTPAQIAWDYNRGKPIARYKLDECSGGTIHSDNKPYDSSLEGTWSGSGGGSQTSVGDCNTAGTAWGNGVNGKFGASMNFDGTDDAVTVSSNTNINLFNEMSFGGWVKTSDSSGNYLTILSKGDFGISGTSSKFAIGLSQQGYANSFYKGLTSNNVASTDLRDGAWHHIFSTISATANSWKLYVDGKQVKDITFTAAASTDTTGDLDIGTFLYSGSPTSYMNGQIDDVQIFNYALTAEQVKQIYNNSSAFQFGN